MPKIIDHKRRKIEILRQAFRLFAREGYENTSLSLLAETCKISRPTLYLYFKDKEEIFIYALKYYTDEMFTDYQEVSLEKGEILPQIRRIVMNVIFKSWINREFITSLGDFIFRKRREDWDFPAEIRKRTFKFDHLIRQMIGKGIRSGEIRDVLIDATATQIMDFIQAYLFKLAVINVVNTQQTVRVIDAYLDSLRRHRD